ncbi:MAG: GNAT family N-acetyltransferase [Marinifilaceae bacterium]
MEQKEFLQEIISYLKKNKICDFIHKAQAYVVFDAVPDCSDSIEYGTYKLNVNRTDNEIMMNCHSKHRNNIRKALRDGIQIKETDNITLTYNLIRRTLERTNSVFYPSMEYLTNLKKWLPDNVKFFIAEKLGVVQGVSVLVFDNFSGYYMYGGSNSSPSPGSLNLLQFEIFKFLRDKGIHQYDFVGARINVQKGSKYEGIQRFKIRFGAKTHKGYTFRVVIRPLKFLLFKLSTKVYGIITGNKYHDVIDQVKKEVNTSQ